jgi:dipeptidase D
MTGVLQDLEPHSVWTIFEEITSVPRPSKKEQKIRQWITQWAQKNNLTYKEDNVGNILLWKEGTDVSNPTLILQAHMDMVCQKDPHVEIDFETDPIPVKIADDYVTAEGTSLGADNGIGMAYALAALTDSHLQHGPLEVLLTVDEETGLNGAFNIATGFFTGKYLLNLDWEKIGEIIVSSAGGGNITYSIPYEHADITGYCGIYMAVEGLQGGHSGLDIHLPRLNAIKVLIEGIAHIKKDTNLLITSIQGGTASNSIPREGECIFMVSQTEKNNVLSSLNTWKNETIARERDAEPDINIIISETEEPSCLSPEKSDALYALLSEIPHGPLSYNEDIEGLVQTSNNLGVVTTPEDTIEVTMHSRSSVRKELEDLRNQLHTLGTAHGAQVIMGNTYPGWKSNPQTPFLSYIKNIYKSVYPSVTITGVHAGLECGVLSGLDPQLQLASLGPEIENAHTPRERVNIESVEIMWNVIKEIIQNMRSLQ